MAEEWTLDDATHEHTESQSSAIELPNDSESAREFRQAQSAMTTGDGAQKVPSLHIDFGTKANDRLLIASAGDGPTKERDKAPSPQVEAKDAEAKKEAALLTKIANEMDKSSRIDTKALAPIIQKHIQGSETPRQEAQKVLSQISRESKKYDLTIQGLGKNVMIYRAAKVADADSDLVPLPGVELNDRKPSQPRHGIRR